MLGPLGESRTALSLVGTAVVDAGDSTPRTFVAQTGLNHVRGYANVPHSGGRCATQIMHAPRREPPANHFRDTPVKSPLAGTPAAESSRAVSEN
jgi:hypothetical protein